MPEKKVRRIEKIQFANMGYKAVGIYARVSTCLLSFIVWLCRFLR